MLPDRLKLDLAFSPERLRADLEKLESEDWINHFVKQNYDGDWNVLPLRGPKGAEHPILMAYSDPTCEEFEDSPFLLKCPYFIEVLTALPFELHAARLMSLSPGSRIKEHRDHDLSMEDGEIRLHIPIKTSDQVEFRLNGSRVTLAEGECWYLRLSDPHSVFNGGNDTRVHLVIDAPATNAAQNFLTNNTIH